MRLPYPLAAVFLALATAVPVRAQATPVPAGIDLAMGRTDTTSAASTIPTAIAGQARADSASAVAAAAPDSGATAPTPVGRDSVSAALRGGAPVVGLRAAVHTAERVRADRPNAAATGANLGQSRALMVVGAGALLVGAIIGGTPGTIIMVGGAVVGLVGLYQYLQ